MLGKLQEKHGFDGTSRFWRVTLKDNWGAFSTVVHRIALFGVDLKLQAWLHQLGFDKYFPAFLDAGFAQMSDLFELTKPQMESIIELPGHRRKITLALRDIMETLIAGELRDLWWGVAPPARCQENTPVPAFSVRGAKNCTDPVELIVHGCPSVTGTLVRSLAPSQAAPNGPSEAVFDDIVLAPAGDYLIEVHSIERPDILVRQEAPISVGTNIAPQVCVQIRQCLKLLLFFMLQILRSRMRRLWRPPLTTLTICSTFNLMYKLWAFTIMIIIIPYKLSFLLCEPHQTKVFCCLSINLNLGRAIELADVLAQRPILNLLHAQLPRAKAIMSKPRL